MTATTPTRGQTLAWRNAIFVVFLLPGLGIASWISRLPAVRDILDLSPGQVGLLVLGISVGSIAGLVASGRIVERIGAITTITWGLVVVAIGLVVVGLGATVVPSFAVVFVGLLLFGASSGITDVAMNVSGAANERALGRTIMPIFHAFFSFGTMIGAGLGALAELVGLPIAVHLGVVGVAVIGGVFAVRSSLQPETMTEDEAAEGDPGPNARQSARGRLAAWADPRTLLIGVMALAAAFAEGSANDWLAIASVDGHGLSNESGALVFAVFVTAMTVGRLAGVPILDRFGRVPILRGSFVLAVVGVSIFIFVPVVPIAIVGVVLWGLGSALGFPVAMSAAADDPRKAAARVGVVATIGYLAFLVGPPVIGFIGEQTGVLAALVVVLALAAVGVLVAGGAREQGQRAS